MTTYTPAEIIAGGVQDTRESFANLYVEVHELRQEAAYYYHRAFVDDRPEPQQEGTIDFHPAPAEFGGKELERPARQVRLDRLTQKGLALYVHGVRAALEERDELLHQIDEAEDDIDRMLIAMDGTIAHIVDRQPALHGRARAPSQERLPTGAAHPVGRPDPATRHRRIPPAAAGQ